MLPSLKRTTPCGAAKSEPEAMEGKYSGTISAGSTGQASEMTPFGKRPWTIATAPYRKAPRTSEEDERDFLPLDFLGSGKDFLNYGRHGVLVFLRAAGELLAGGPSSICS